MNLLFGLSGRIGRGGWWLAQLANLVVIVLCVGIFAAFVHAQDLPAGADPSDIFQGAGISIFLVFVAAAVLLIWINVASTVKRFHDRNKSGWWFLIIFVPYIGSLWQIVECGFLAGSPGINDFGEPGGSGGWADVERYGFDPDAGRIRAEPVQQKAATGPVNVSPVQRMTKTPGFGRRGS